MFREIDHPLLWKVFKTTCLHCHKDSPTHTSDAAYCGCGGWEAWATTKNEIKQAHQQHLAFRQAQHQEAVQQLRDHEGSRHEIRWNAAQDAARCSWCNWSLHGFSTAKILVAFEHHKESVKDAIT